MSSFRISSEQLAQETNSEVRNLLRYELNAALTVFIREDRPVYLEGLGIFAPVIKSEPCSLPQGENLCTWSETTRTVRFEKCYELIQLHREKFPHIAEMRELVSYIYPRLPVFITAKHDVKTVRRYLRGVIDGVRREVIESGHSAALSSIGDLFALHNRQGNSFSEWYAGADLFLKPSYHEALGNSEKRLFPRPLLSHGWELLEAAYGVPLAKFKINLPGELTALGYDASLLPANESSTIDVAMFECSAKGGGAAESSSNVNSRYLFCTDGLRQLGLTSGATTKRGCEIVFQLKAAGDSAKGSRDRNAMAMCARPLTVAWILLQSARSKTLRVGAGLSVDVPLFTDTSKSGGRALGSKIREDMCAILATPFAAIRSEQLSEDGPFNYINIVTLTKDEAALTEHYPSEYLLTLLEMRDLQQLSNPYRPSLLTRTELLHRYGKYQVVNTTEEIDEQELSALEAYAIEAREIPVMTNGKSNGANGEKSPVEQTASSTGA